MKNLIGYLLSLFFLTSCVSGSYILTGQKRDPIKSVDVILYTEPPLNYEVIAIVKASSGSGFTQQVDMDFAVHEIKYQAAQLGANGVLLSGTGDVTSTTAGVYSHGATYTSSSTAQVVSGKAIYVFK